MIELTGDELRLLRELRDSPQGRTISGNNSRGGLDRLVAAGYVKATAVSIDSVLYEITQTGLAALAQAER